MDAEAFQARRKAASAPRRATAADRAAIAKLFAASFATDPVVSWLVRKDARQEWARERMFDVLMHRYGLPGNETWVADGVTAAALWLPPERANLKLPWWQEIALIPAIAQVVSLSGMSRMDAFRKATTRYHPKTRPHWYLMTIGVDPKFQGQGLGSAMLEATLASIDAKRMPAYLESSSPKNVPLYRRHGFEVTDEFRPLPDSPPLWGMWREPKPV